MTATPLSQIDVKFMRVIGVSVEPSVTDISRKSRMPSEAVVATVLMDIESDPTV